MVGKIHFRRFLPFPSGGFWKKANPWKIHVNLRIFIFSHIFSSKTSSTWVSVQGVEHFLWHKILLQSTLQIAGWKSLFLFSICSRKYNIHSCSSTFMSLSSQPCWFVEGYDCLVVRITYYYVLDCFGMYYSMSYRTINMLLPIALLCISLLVYRNPFRFSELFRTKGTRKYKTQWNGVPQNLIDNVSKILTWTSRFSYHDTHDTFMKYPGGYSLAQVP